MLTDFNGDEAKKNFFLKKNQTGRLKKLRFSTPPILNFYFFQKYQGLVRLIDVKDIDMAQPIWPF